MAMAATLTTKINWNKFVRLDFCQFCQFCCYGRDRKDKKHWNNNLRLAFCLVNFVVQIVMAATIRTKKIGIIFFKVVVYLVFILGFNDP